MPAVQEALTRPQARNWSRGLGAPCLGASPSAPFPWLRNRRQVTQLLLTSVLSSAKWGLEELLPSAKPRANRTGREQTSGGAHPTAQPMETKDLTALSPVCRQDTLAGIPLPQLAVSDVTGSDGPPVPACHPNWEFPGLNRVWLSSGCSVFQCSGFSL